MLTTLLTVSVLSVYDGDTFRVDLPCDLPIACHNIPVRIRGIDTPEIRTKCSHEKLMGYTAKSYLTSILYSADSVQLENIERGKYFRLVSDVYVDGISVSKEMLDSGFARAYDGGTRDSWCN